MNKIFKIFFSQNSKVKCFFYSNCCKDTLNSFINVFHTSLIHHRSNLRCTGYPFTFLPSSFLPSSFLQPFLLIPLLITTSLFSNISSHSSLIHPTHSSKPTFPNRTSHAFKSSCSSIQTIFSLCYTPQTFKLSSFSSPLLSDFQPHVHPLPFQSHPSKVRSPQPTTTSPSTEGLQRQGEYLHG